MEIVLAIKWFFLFTAAYNITNEINEIDMRPWCGLQYVLSGVWDM